MNVQRVVLALALIAAAVMAVSFSPTRSYAQGGLCPLGYRFTGDYRDEQRGNQIVRHPICARSAAWSPGAWRRGTSVIIQNSACFSTWTCERTGESVMGRDARFYQTPAVRRDGWCSASGGECECVGAAQSPPAGACQTCVESAECADPNLGWRTREAMGCCT